MKSTLKISKINSIDDVNNIRQAVSNNEGVIACQIIAEKDQIIVFFDEIFTTEDKIIESIEDLGYSVN
ncbi:MAG: heavy-metal-associated domain-containing protein [Bacillota bacterium]|nr:heavy-metal-associated domain-containing protein [Bacillota bacterium]